MKRFGAEKGRQYMQALAKQEPRTEASARGNALLAAGEFAAYIGRGHAAEILKKKGAPVEWIKNPDPLVVQPATVQIAKNPPHPNSAKLLIDFMLSDQAAEVLAKENRFRDAAMLRGLTRSLERSTRKRFCRCRWKSCREITRNIWKSLEIISKGETRSCSMAN